MYNIDRDREKLFSRQVFRVKFRIVSLQNVDRRSNYRPSRRSSFGEVPTETPSTDVGYLHRERSVYASIVGRGKGRNRHRGLREGPSEGSKPTPVTDHQGAATPPADRTYLRDLSRTHTRTLIPYAQTRTRVHIHTGAKFIRASRK